MDSRKHTAARADTVTNIFGFAGKEIFPIDNQIGLLHAADLDGDGLNDLRQDNAALQQQVDSLRVVVAKQDTVIRQLANLAGMPLAR